MANTHAVGFHDLVKTPQSPPMPIPGPRPPKNPPFHWETQFIYTFEHFFHPFVGELIAKLNRDSLPGMMDASWQQNLSNLDPAFFQRLYNPTVTDKFKIVSFPKAIDVAERGPYANYNWELFFHIPLTVAVHLSKSQRFAEAQRWFHYIFDPTANDQSVEPPKRFWKFIAFRQDRNPTEIGELLRLLSDPHSDPIVRQTILNGYQAILEKPFQPHAVARTRHLAYQYSVVMKYLNNLIAWGDNLFQQDTVESINEATQRYVLAANLLGPRPQRIPPRGAVKPKTFAQLKKGLDPMGNALVELEGQFPFNLADGPADAGDGGGGSPLFGIGRTLYFCIPRNEKMLGYWDTVSDRLFKIRHCMNLEGIARPLALFDPPIDPGMLVKAAAAGIDIKSIVNGLNQPIGPVRCTILVQKALELAGEVRGLGAALLAALEKRDGESLASLRQGHEILVHQRTQDIKFLQWKSAQETTKSLLTSRATALERLHYYQRQLGCPSDPNAPDVLPLDRRDLTAENFDAAYGALVGQYDKALTVQKLAGLNLTGETSPAQQSGATGQGRLYLNVNENAELNEHLPAAKDLGLAASVVDTVASVLTFIPEFDINLHFWGLGAKSTVFGGSKLSDAGKIAAGVLRTVAALEQAQAGMVARTAGHERRADDWMLQHNLAAREVMQIGRQILTSLIAEQIARHEYVSLQQQIKNAQEVDRFLHDKFTNDKLYVSMQGEISRLYYEYYRFAFDTARRAEKTMKQELMRPELDAQDFVKFNYWDAGWKGLLSGEALYLDVKRMELAYNDHNKRELELTRHISLRQLNPLALLALKATGTCQVTIPEWLFDLDCPGHYMRRLKSVALSIPSVVGPYTSVHCTLSLLKSSLRRSAIAKDGEYARQGSEDERFVNYGGAVQSIVTSMGQSDSGLFETNLRDERFLPFEGAGAESTWKLDLPKAYPVFDYATIADVILHVRYTARQGVPAPLVTKSLDDLFQTANQAGLALLFSLRYDFPSEWAAFLGSAKPFTTAIRRDHFPYLTQGKEVTITGIDLCDGEDGTPHKIDVPPSATEDLKDPSKQQFVLTVNPAVAGSVLKRDAEASFFAIVRYTLSTA